MEDRPSPDHGIRRYLVPQEIGGVEHRVPIFVGQPGADEHPLVHQDRWLRRQRGVAIRDKVMHAFGELHRLSLEADEPFVELVEFAMSENDAETDTKDDDDGDGGGNPGDGPAGPGSKA